MSFLSIAPATARAHVVCLEFGIARDLWDASGPTNGNEFYEEYGRDDGAGSFVAQRWIARVRDDADGRTLWGWQPLDGDGCADFDLPTGVTDLQVQWVRWAMWDADADPDAPDTGNQIVGYNCTPTEECLFQLLDEVIPVDTDGTTELSPDTVLLDDDVTLSDLGLWAATFSEERFASLDEQTTTESRVYIGSDPGGILPATTQADYTFGNQPSVCLETNAANSKFTVAHEYGHLQTIVVATVQNPPRIGEADIDYGGNEHSFNSIERQSAASIEGMANWYAVATWHDLEERPPPGLPNCVMCSASERYIQPSSATSRQPFLVSPTPTDPQCDPPGGPVCGAGDANEWDYLVALSEFYQSSSDPDLRLMFTMVSDFFINGTWVVTGSTGDFWTNFSSRMATHLGSANTDWSTAAAAWSIDQ